MRPHLVLALPSLALVLTGACGSSDGGFQRIGDPPGAGGASADAAGVGGASSTGANGAGASAAQHGGTAFGGFSPAGGSSSSGGFSAGVGGGGGQAFGHGAVGMGGAPAGGTSGNGGDAAGGTSGAGGAPFGGGGAPVGAGGATSGSGGTSGNGGASGSSSGSSGTSGNGGAPGPLGAVCTGLDVGGVYALAQLLPGDATSTAVGAFSSPTSFCTGFPPNVVAAAIVPTTGGIVYLAGSATVIGLHAVADPLEWTGSSWVLSSTPTGNDTALDVSACGAPPATARELLAYPDDGAIVYGCASSPPTYFDATGGTVLSNGARILALGHGGLRLVGATTVVGAVPAILDAQDMEIPLSGLSFGTSAVVDARAAPAGFFLAVENTTGGVTLVTMDPDGVGMVLGDYPPLPAGTTVLGNQTLDAAGALFARVRESDLTAALVKRTPLAATAEVVLEDKTLPAPTPSDMASPGFALHVDGAAFLFR